MDHTIKLLDSLMSLIEEQIRLDLEQGKPESIADIEWRVLGVKQQLQMDSGDN